MERSHGEDFFVEYFREKIRAREVDKRALESGQKSLDDLRRENGHFAGLKARVNLKAAKALC